MSGKGDGRRPQQVSDEEMGLRWKMSFGTDEEREDAKARLEFLKLEREQNKNG